MRSQGLALTAAFLAALTLAACDNADDTTTTTPAADAAPPAMEAVPPAAEAAPPAMQAVPPAVEAAGLTLEALTGIWAANAAGCANAAEVTTIAAEAIGRPGMACAVTSTTPGATGLQVGVVCAGAGGAAGAAETWTITAANTAAPITAIDIAMGIDTVALARCPL